MKKVTNSGIKIISAFALFIASCGGGANAQKPIGAPPTETVTPMALQSPEYQPPIEADIIPLSERVIITIQNGYIHINEIDRPDRVNIITRVDNLGRLSTLTPKRDSTDQTPNTYNPTAYRLPSNYMVPIINSNGEERNIITNGDHYVIQITNGDGSWTVMVLSIPGSTQDQASELSGDIGDIDLNRLTFSFQ